MIAPGMDHDLYPYSALPDRAPFALPGGAEVALCPVVYLEDWPLAPPEGAHADPRFGDPYGRFDPDYRTHTWREYGLRIGIFRLFDLFDRHALPATLAVNAGVARRCPALLDQAARRGWAIAAHGEHGNAMITGAQSEAQIAAHVARCADTLADLTGTRPRGWISQDFGHSAGTPQILARAGFDWLADWPNDEQPYAMHTDPPILSIPVLSDLDDVQMLWHRRVATPAWPGLVGAACDVMQADARAGGGARVLVLGLHAWLFGMPHRVRYLDAALGDLAARPGLWPATLDRLADHCRAATTPGDAP